MRSIMARRSGSTLLIASVWAVALLMRADAAGTAQSPAAAPATPARTTPARTTLPRTTLPRTTPARAVGTVAYEQQVQAIFTAKCIECHSQEKRKGGLSLATYGDALEGGRSGASIRPGHSANSLLVQRLMGEIEPQMPKDEPPLADAEMALIRRWIDEGARPTPTSAPAPPPWEAPLTLDRPDLPRTAWPAWSQPLDRLVSAYLIEEGVREPVLVTDLRFARRAYLDIWGLPPSPEELRAFIADRSPDKRTRLAAALLADSQKYADHWISFWNDLLRNEDGVSYFSEEAGRKSITDWLHPALTTNLPYDRFVEKLLNPSAPGDPEGFLIGVNWRGETSAAVTPWMQASQNTAQVFLGVNLKCNACHDSFINKWKLKDAYALAAFFSPEPRLQLFRCDVARDQYAEPQFLFPTLNRTPSSSSLADRRAAAAAIFTDPRNGRLARTLVNRVWERLLGRGFVPVSDEMDGVPWSPAVLDWVASDFATHNDDLKHLIATIVSSRAYQMRAVPRTGQEPARTYAFRGPEIRRLTAEQFADAIGSITGEWSVSAGRPAPRATDRKPTDSDPVSTGVYAREWRTASTRFTRALGRPIRDQVISVRAAEATTLQGLELVNGELLTRWLQRGARRMLAELPPDPPSLFNAFVGGRYASARPFDVDISRSSRLWLIVSDTGSNAPEVVQPIWAQAELVGPAGVVPLSSLTPIDATGLRSSTAGADANVNADAGGPASPSQAHSGQASSGQATPVAVSTPSRLVYDISGKGFTRFRGAGDVQNPRSEIGSTLNPSLRFFVFDAEPNMDRLIPPAPAPPLPAVTPVTTIRETVDRVFTSVLLRLPTPAERQVAEAALRDPARPGRPSVDGLADLLWAVLMKPEFQLIY